MDEKWNRSLTESEFSVHPNEQRYLQNGQHQETNPEVCVLCFVAECHHADIGSDATAEQRDTPKVLLGNPLPSLLRLAFVDLHHCERHD